MNVFKQLKEYYWSERRLLFLSLFALSITTALTLVYPYLLKFLIDDIIIAEQFKWVPYLALSVVIVISIKGLFNFIQSYAGARLGNRVAQNMRDALYKKLQYLSFQYYDQARTGDLMSRLTADLEAIRQFIGFGFTQIYGTVIMLLFGSLMMLWINWELTLITLVTMPILGFLAFRFETKIHPAFRSIRIAMSNLTTAVQENITGVRTIKSFAREPHEVEKFSLRSDEYRSTQISTANIWARFFPIMELLSSLSVVILVGVGGYMVIRSSLTLGELVAFTSLIWYIIGPMWNLGFLINNFTQSKASGERIIEILHQYVHVKDKPGAIELKKDRVEGHVKYEQVTFAYPNNKPSVHDLSIDAPPGTIIGLLGATGAGKSTIIQLLFRAYNVREGRILLDGININDLSIESLREQIAIVFQETFLFSATIRNNITYGVRGATDEQVIRAAQMAKADEFISELPLGYDTIVGERGLGLSGGQKQRIAIARALLKNPKILILDDATSAVDMETEHEIQAGFKELMSGKTTFIIAHRISSLKHADEIIVLNEGHVVQRGTHDELLTQPGPYLETFKIQYADHPDLVQMIGERGSDN